MLLVIFNLYYELGPFEAGSCLWNCQPEP